MEIKRENYTQGVNADEEGESKKRKREEKRGKMGLKLRVEKIKLEF